MCNFGGQFLPHFQPPKSLENEGVGPFKMWRIMVLKIEIFDVFSMCTYCMYETTQEKILCITWSSGINLWWTGKGWQLHICILELPFLANCVACGIGTSKAWVWSHHLLHSCKRSKLGKIWECKSRKAGLILRPYEITLVFRLQHARLLPSPSCTQVRQDCNIAATSWMPVNYSE